MIDIHRILYLVLFYFYFLSVFDLKFISQDITEKIAGGRSRAQSVFDEGNSLAPLFDEGENSNIQVC